MATERRLLLASALMLFLELALIRWLGANVVHLSYFTNFVLLGSFLGIGLGFLLARTSHSALRWSPLVLASLVALVLLVPVRINRASDQIIYFTATDPTGPPAWVTLPLIFAAVAAALLGTGRGGRPVLRRAPAAGRLSPGPVRQPDRHRGLHRPVVPAVAVVRLGRDGGRRVPPAAAAADPAAGSGGGPGDGRPAGVRERRGRCQLVALLQGADRSGARLQRHRPAADLGQWRPAPGDALGASEADRGAAVRASLRAVRRQPAWPRAHHRRRLRQRRGDRAGQGRPARRRGRDRPADPADREATTPGPALPGPPRRHVRQRRSGVSPAVAHLVRPDPVRPPGLPGAGQRRELDPAGVLPVHQGSRRGRPRPPRPRRRVRDVQLLPRGPADRAARGHGRRRLRSRPVCRPRSAAAAVKQSSRRV